MDTSKRDQKPHPMNKETQTSNKPKEANIKIGIKSKKKQLSCCPSKK